MFKYWAKYKLYKEMQLQKAAIALDSKVMLLQIFSAAYDFKGFEWGNNNKLLLWCDRFFIQLIFKIILNINYRYSIF